MTCIVVRGMQKEKAVFFLQLNEAEGEFRVGLARRTFDEAPAEREKGEVRVWWFQRISTNRSWGVQPAFKPCMRAEKGARRPSPFVESVPIESFLKIPVQLTRTSARDGELRKPVLTKDCMQLLRKMAEHVESDDKGEGEEEDVEEAEDASDSSDAEMEQPAPRRRTSRARITDSSDEEPAQLASNVM
eukprot:5858276-Pleurochrysis_carterae.AAC.1